MQWHSFTSPELSVPHIPEAEGERRDFMQIIKIHTHRHTRCNPKKKKYQTQKQHTDSLQKALVIVKRLRSQSAETGKRV